MADRWNALKLFFHRWWRGPLVLFPSVNGPVWQALRGEFRFTRRVAAIAVLLGLTAVLLALAALLIEVFRG